MEYEHTRKNSVGFIYSLDDFQSQYDQHIQRYNHQAYELGELVFLFGDQVRSMKCIDFRYNKLMMVYAHYL